MSTIEQNLIGLAVETQSGQYLGRVKAVEKDPGADKIIRFYVRPTFFKRIFCRQFIIHREQVIKITPEKIIVDDNIRKVLGRDWAKNKFVTPVAE